MQQKEFEALTGKTVTAEEYAEIEKVYMAAAGMEKQEFCAAWKEGKLCYIVDELVKYVQSLESQRERQRRNADAQEEKNEATARLLLKKASEHKDGDLKAAAIDLVGLEQVVLIDVEEGYKLSNAERDYILENL